MTDFPVSMTTSGAQPTPPADIRTALLNLVSATNPGYTANLPGSLIEDIASTDVGAISLCDSARVELINSMTPYGANLFVLNQLGQIYLGQGFQIGAPTNTSVFAVFAGSVGFAIQRGFVISDGVHQYTVQDPGIINSSGFSDPLFCLAVNPGSWAVPIGTVTTIVTSVPTAITLSVTNPNTGTPGGDAQTEADYRAQVLAAGLSASQGMGRYLKTLLDVVPGVQQRLVSVRQQGNTTGWEIIVGGGDPYDVANAIWQALFDVSNLVGSVINVTGITNATLGVVTTDLNHGFVTGQNDVHIAGVVGMTGVNGGPYTVTVLTEKTFTFGVNTTGSGSWVSGGIITPNNRNISVDIQDYPDTYQINFVNPPSQSVAIDVTWNTTSTNFVSPTAVAQLGAPAIAAYVNSIPVGLPVNLFELQTVFQESIVTLIPPQLLTRMVFVVNVNGITVSPSAGTGIIAGDPESYFSMTSTDVTVVQG